MAEAIGLVVGVASLGIQLIETIKKVKELCESVKDAPAQLEDAIEEITVMGEIIELMAPPDAEQLNGPGKLVSQSIELCRKALEQLRILIKELEARLEKRRHWGRFSISMNKESIERLVRRLDRCKGLLQMSHQVYMSAQSDGQRRLLEELQSAQKAVTQGDSDELVVSDKQTTCTHRRSTKWLPQRRSIRIWMIPGWSYSRVLELTTTSVPAGWTASLLFYRVGVGFDDPFYLACRENNLEGARRLLDAGKATVHDLTEFGGTMLVVAILFGALDVAKFLVEHGISVNRARYLFFVLENFFIHRFEAEIQNALRTPTQTLSLSGMQYRYMQNLEELGVELDLFDHDLKIDFTLSGGVFEQILWTPVSKMTLDEQVEVLQNYIRMASNHLTRSLVEVCRIFKQSLEDLMALHCGKDALLRLLGSIFGCREMRYARDSAEFRGAHSYLVSKLSQCTAAKACLHLESPYNAFLDKTPLQYIVGHRFLEIESQSDVLPKGFTWKIRASKDHALQDWVQALQSVGVDIVAYGEQEVAIIRAHHTNSWTYKVFGIASGNEEEADLDRADLANTWNYDILGIAYGPCVEDWHFWIREYTDCYAGEFWDLIDHPERSMPGAWV